MSFLIGSVQQIIVQSMVQVPAQIEEETMVSATRRSKRGPNNMSKGRPLITKLNELSELITPSSVMGPYKFAILVVVRENVPIMYRCWTAKDNTWAEPDSLKQI